MITKKGQQLKDKLSYYGSLYCNEYVLTVAYGNMSILLQNNKAVASLATALRIGLEIVNHDISLWLTYDEYIESLPLSFEEEREERDDSENIGFPDYDVVLASYLQEEYYSLNKYNLDTICDMVSNDWYSR